MNPTHFERVQALFAAAVELPAAERAEFLRRQPPADQELVAEVVDLLAHHKDETDVGTAGDPAAAPPGSLGINPTQVDRYRILERLGEGGMGVVYRAEQSEPIRRQVALKLVKAGMDTRAVLARFERERQALAMMDHDGIAKVFDCGSDASGRPYFVMELVRGVPIDAYCDTRSLSLVERLGLIQRVCEAVQHAHQKGVVHRDLKPSNILVVEDGTKRGVKVIDFGLAKVLDEDLAGDSLATQQYRVLGTPEYMAPEQADQRPSGVDTRADVYSLGVVLYEMLVGSLPFPAADLRRRGIETMRRIICEQEPPRPSDRLSQMGAASGGKAASRRMTVEGLRRVLRNDLDWVVGKALEKDPERRYGSVGALAEDLQRFLDHEPLVAGPPSKMYRLRKVARRYRAQILVAALVMVTAIVGGGLAAWNAVHANAAETRAKDALHDFELLASVSRTRDALDSADQLFITWPDRGAALERWLGTVAARALGMRADVDAALARLQAAGGSSPSGDDTPAKRESQVFLQDALGKVRESMQRLAGEVTGGMTRRLYWSRRQWQLSLQHPNARRSWAEVRADLTTNPRYADASIELTDADVIGLVPIDKNPVTGYWEFYDLRSAWDGHTDPARIEIPRHREDGSIHVREVTGIVFVLLPGGPYLLGPGYEDGAPEPGVDPTDKLPSHKVTLEPFFCSRHEITRAQWWRLTGTAPFYYPYAFGQDEDRELFDDFPAESISWAMATRALGGIGCSLPTEAQWEYACRGGTRWPWWSGPTLQDLQGCANIGDRTRLAANPTETWVAPITDGFSMLAPVGSYRANDFGLFDTHGNVHEWCANPYNQPAMPEVVDLDAQLASAPPRVPHRGGSCVSAAAEARCAKREGGTAVFVTPQLGLRAVRQARHPWRDRVQGFDPATLAAKEAASPSWSPTVAPRVVAGRWRVMHGAGEPDLWEEQVNASESGLFIVSFGKRMGAAGTFRATGGSVLFECAKYVERWTHVDGRWRTESWTSKEDMASGKPPAGVGTAEWQFSVPYIGPGK